MKRLLLYVLPTVFTLAACHEDAKEKPTEEVASSIDTIQPPISEKEIDSVNNIYVVGTSDNIDRLKGLNFLSYNNFFGGNDPTMNKEVIGDSIHIHYNQSTGPQFQEFMYFGTNDFVDTKAFITPGDSVFFTIKNDKITFTGTHPAEYNYYAALTATGYNYYSLSYQGNLQQYKKDVTEVYTKGLAFLEEYIAKHPEVSDAFKKTAKDELFFDYYKNLMLPRSVASEGIEGLYFNNTQGIYGLVEDEYMHGEGQLFNSKEYFNNIRLEDFQRPDLLTNQYFKQSLPEFIRYYFSGQEELGYTLDNFLKEKEFIKANFTGELQDYLMGQLIYWYYKRGFGRSQETIDTLKQNLKAYYAVTKDVSSFEVMQELKGKIDNFDLKIPARALQDKVLTITGDTLTIGQILEKAKGTKKVIDVWASWCGPCTNEISKGSTESKKVAKETNTSFIYFSSDVNQEQWLKSVNKLKDKFASEHIYLILDYKNSHFDKFFHIEWIPYMIVLDEKNKILYDDAPRPSSGEDFRKILK